MPYFTCIKNTPGNLNVKLNAKVYIEERLINPFYVENY